MGKVLLVGKGKLYKSVKDSIRAIHTDIRNVETVDYDEEWFKPTRNQNVFDEKIRDPHQYNSVYLFPHSLLDGMKLVKLYSQFKPFRLFVVTCNHQNSNLYKKMGADFVIFSKPDGYSYNWLLTSES
ncbi:hypothetical protein [Peribacillus muralis]|uniref:hypothetical protein n=1 Tax=Peribacillus muralis TaxID=264697 RepID=UPI0036730324